MTLEKAELKMSVAHELGCQVDDQLAGAEKDGLRHAGAKSALFHAAKEINRQLHAAVKRDLEEGAFEGEKFPESELQLQSLINRWISRASGLCENMAQMHESQEIVKAGETAGLKKVIDRIKKYHDAERQKAAALKDAEDGKVVPIRGGTRASGQHPGPTLKDRRLAEGPKTAKKKPVKRKPTKKKAPAKTGK